MSTNQPTGLNLTIPIFGECTLISLGMMPKNLRMYKDLLEISKLFDLEELPELTHYQTQEIFKAVAFRISEHGMGNERCAVVWLSGRHEAYSLLDMMNKNQEKETCITSINIFSWDDETISTKGIICCGPLDMTLEEIPTMEQWEIENINIVYCLFLGTYSI